MKNSRATADVYLRYLQLAQAIRGLPALGPLDPLEERILNLIARSTLEQARLSVRDMMGKQDLGAPATIHGRLKSMREKGWIVLADTDDARRKQIELSKPAIKHLTRLSAAMRQAASAVA